MTYFVFLHLKLSSLFYSTHLIDIFAYELPTNLNTNTAPSLTNSSNTVVVYHFHNIFFQKRMFCFILNKKSNFLNKSTPRNANFFSITELFLNANWLEREVLELHGVFFVGKKDLRNLMLQYGDTSTPMLKTTPTVGTKEIFYDVLTDTLIQTPISLQF